MDLELNGKTAIVTGGSRGIGKAVAAQLMAEGVDVALAARDEATLAEAVRELSAGSDRRVLGLGCDTGDDAAVRGMVERVLGELGRIDILVNCAAKPGGQAAPPGMDAITDELFWEDMNVKVMGYLRCARAVAPQMRAQGWGRIINVSGLAARQSGSMVGSMRNVAVSALTKNLADELGRDGINVTVVHPGLTVTERTPEVLAARAARTGAQSRNCAGRCSRATRSAGRWRRGTWRTWWCFWRRRDPWRSRGRHRGLVEEWDGRSSTEVRAERRWGGPGRAATPRGKPAANEGFVQLIDAGAAEQGQGAAGFHVEQVEGKVQAGLPGCVETVEIGASGHAGAGAEDEGLDDVGAAADAAVEDDLGVMADRLDNGGEGGDGAVELAVAGGWADPPGPRDDPAGGGRPGLRPAAIWRLISPSGWRPAATGCPVWMLASLSPPRRRLRPPSAAAFDTCGAARPTAGNRACRPAVYPLVGAQWGLPKRRGLP